MADPLPQFLANTTAVPVPGGRTVTLYTAGAASSADVVLLESGLGQGAAYWGAVVDGIVASAPELRVVGYDRAGYGTSSPPTDDRSLHAMAGDLSAVVSSLNASRLVLVGHSWGGPIIRTYVAASSSAPLHGMVLVDHSDERCPFYFSRSMSWAFWLQSWLYQPLAAVGLLGMMMRRGFKTLPRVYAARSVADSTSAAAARAGALEVANVAGLRELLTHPPELGDTPLVVISAKDGGPHKEGSTRGLLSAAHKETAASVKNGTFVLAEKSGHIVPVDEPGLVAGHIVSLFRGRVNAD
ncbi:Soluble epoxide hydrolase [Vanrija pseudolonga]|uniref:Soluble epoxide hydrolase n=1 Tax=Vanrija pseudolonga TaxID=143232 RepID=A0AAF1BGL5_9TREE|nr:Soluble epoxide hydrolase [Vanrija pseudolonga]